MERSDPELRKLSVFVSRSDRTTALNQGRCHSVCPRMRLITPPSIAKMTGSAAGRVCSAIERIPPELLLDIILYFSPKLGTRTRELATLSGVCRAWASLINTSPSLWTSISSSEPRKVYQRSLEQSKGRPIHFFFDNSDAEDNDLTPFMAAACNQARRWKSVSFLISEAPAIGTMVALRRLRRLTVPLLEEVEIDAMNDFTDAISIFNGGTPSLKLLSLTGFQIPWDTGLVSNLQTLRLFYWYDEGPSPWHTVEMLASCPGLVQLTLRYWSANHLSTPDEDTPILLPALESITLDLDTPTLVHVLRRVRIPNCTHYDVSPGWLQEDDTLLFEPEMEHLGPMFKKLTQSCVTQEIRINFSNTYFEYLGADEERTILHTIFTCPEWESLNGEEAADRFLQYIPLDLGSPLKLRMEKQVPEEINVGAFDAVVLLFSERVEVLQFNAQEIHVPDSFIEYLAVPYPAEGGVVRWPFPNLRSLIIRTNKGQQTTHDYFLQVGALIVDRSFPPVDADLESATYELPAKLEKLVFQDQGTGTIPNEVYALRELVGIIMWGDKELGERP